MSTRTRAPQAPGELPPRPPAPPRSGDRRATARRQEGRRRLRILVVVGALVALVAIAWGVSVSPLLDVDKMEVRGARRTTPAQLESASGIHHGDALLWLDAGRAVSGIEALPFVRSARVVKQWPDTVRVTVTERVPVAWVDGAAGHVAVDGSGRVLEVVADPPARLPQLLGVKTVSAPGGRITPAAGARVAAALNTLAAAGTKSITLSDTGLTMQLLSGAEVRLGDDTLVRAKVRAALAVLGAMAGTDVHYVDVSVPTNPVAG